MFLAGYIGLSLPVVALGVMTQYLSLRLSLLVFTAALTVGVALVTPRLLIGGSDPAAPRPLRADTGARARAARTRSHTRRPSHPSDRVSK